MPASAVKSMEENGEHKMTKVEVLVTQEEVYEVI